MVPTGGRKCLRFIIDKTNKDFGSFLKDILDKFGASVLFHRPIMDEDGVFVTFLFEDGNDDQLILFLWELVLYFRNGPCPGVEKVVFFRDKEKEIKLHPIDTAVS